MKNIWKRSISLMLVFLMLISCMPVGALAVEEGASLTGTTPADVAPPADNPPADVTPPADNSPADVTPPADNPPADVTPPVDNPPVNPVPDGDSEPEEDPAVVRVQGMIDALAFPDSEGHTQDSYEAVLGRLEGELSAVDNAAAGLTEEQLVQLDASNAEAVVQAVNNYWLSRIPMMIAAGSGTETDPYIITVGEGETYNGAQLYVWIDTNTSWTTSRHYYADDIQFTKGGTVGTTVSGDSTKTFGAGIYAIYGTTKGSGLLAGHNKDSAPKGYIEIREIKADEADMTLKDGTYNVSVNLKTYSDLTAQKIIDVAVATNKKTVTVNFRDYDNSTWGGHDEWTELTAANLPTFLESDDKNSFQLVCGNTTKEITVTFAESRTPWTVAYTGGTIEYTSDAELITAVTNGLTIDGSGTPAAPTVTLAGTLPTAGETGEVAFTVSVAEDDNNLAYEGTVNVSVSMPSNTFAVTVKAGEGGTASVDLAEAFAGNTVTITATPDDTVSTDGSVGYVKSITVNGTAIEGTTFTMPEKAAEVVVTFATRSITAKENLSFYMNSSGNKKNQYTETLTVDNLATLAGEGDQTTAKVQVYANWGSGRYTDVGSLLTSHCDIPADQKLIKIIWPAEGNLPEVSLEGISVEILDSNRTIQYMDVDADGNETAMHTQNAERLTTATIADGTEDWAKKEGYTISGWNTAADGTGTRYALGSAIEISEDNVILYAQWTVNKYTITWDANGGVFPDGLLKKTTTVAYGEMPVAPTEVPTKTGTAFTGWGEIVEVTGDTTYFAEYADDKNANGRKDDDETATVKVTIDGPGTVTLSGSEKTIITDNGSGAYTVLFDSAAEGGNVITVTATPDDTVGTDGEVGYVVSAPATITLSKGREATVDARFAAYALDEKETTGSLVINKNAEALDISNLKTEVLTAVLNEGFNADEYKVEIKLVSWTDVTEKGWLNATQTAIQTALALADTASFRITKLEQNPVPAVSKEYSLNVLDARPKPVVTATSNEIKFEGKQEIKSVVEDVLALFSIDDGNGNALAVKDYVKWDKTYEWPADGQTAVYKVTVQVPDSLDYQRSDAVTVTVTVIDTTILYTITYLDGYNTEGNQVAEYTIAEDLQMQKPEDPTREFYTFAGWSVQDEIVEIPETVTGDAVYTAVWTMNNDSNDNQIPDETETYTVVYVLGNGEENVTHSDLAWGADMPVIENPVWDKYNFKGWNPAPAATVLAPASGNTHTFTAQWTQNHAVLFISNGEQYGTDEVENEKTLTKPADPVWDDDHDFLGWYIGEGETATEYDFTQPVIENLTLTAKWREDFNRNDIEDVTEEHFTIIYDVDGTLTTLENVLVNIATPTIADPVKENYIFNGWTPALDKTVTADATYVAQWLNDVNNNKVDDTQETITFAIEGEGKVTVGQTAYADGDTMVYDSTAAESTFTLKAAPATTSGVQTETISASYVESIAVDGKAATLTYDTSFAVTIQLAPEGSQTVKVVFAEAGFVYNEERVMSFYPGMKGVELDDIYNTIVNTPKLPGEYTLQYFARPATSHTVQLSSLGLPDTIMSILKLMGRESITIDMPDLWLDVEVNDLSDEIKNAVSLDQACAQYLTYDRIVGLWDVFQNNGGLLGGGSDAVGKELETITQNITNAAMYYGAHSFGFNNTDADAVTERIKVTYGNEQFYIEGETDIELKDMRAPSYVVGNNVSVVYRDYTDEELARQIAARVQNASGNAISGAVVTSSDITDPYTFEGKYVSDTAYELTYRFAGNDTYRPSEGVFQVTVTKAPVKYNAPSVNVNYGVAYNMMPDSSFSLGNRFGEIAEVRDSMIQFVIGVDAAAEDRSRVQLILPAELQSMLDGLIGITGGNTSDGMEMSLSELLEYLAPIGNSSLDALVNALKSIQGITGSDLKIILGGSLPKNVGAYMYGAVSSSSNYEAAYSVNYIIIKSVTADVYLNWNYNDSNNVYSYERLQDLDLGASAYTDRAFTSVHADGTAHISNVISGTATIVDDNGNTRSESFSKTFPAGTDPEEIEAGLPLGTYTQVVSVTSTANQKFNASSITRTFKLVANTVNVEIGDESDTNTADFSAEPKTLDVVLSYDGEAFKPDRKWLKVTYSGVQDDGTAYESTTAPVHAGTYTVTANYIQRNKNGYVIAMGSDEETLTIAPTTLTADDVALDGTLTYNGYEQTQNIRTGEYVNYTVTGNTGTDVGDYTMTITGVGSYQGTVELNWSIARATTEITVDTTNITVPYGEPVVLPVATTNVGDVVTCDTNPDDLVKLGTYTVTYSVAETKNYTAAEKTVTVTIVKADAVIEKAPAAIKNLTVKDTPQALVTPGIVIGGTMQYSLDGTNWSEEIPTATDIGEYTVYYRVVVDENHNEVDGGSVLVTITEKPTAKVIQFPADGDVQPGTIVEINGENHVVDDSGMILLPLSTTGNLIATTYVINPNSNAEAPDGDQNADAHKAYPLHMSVWIAIYDAETDTYQTAVEIQELRDFFSYGGMSIRYSSNVSEKHGIRIITSVNAAKRASLIEGSLIQNDALAGWKLVEYGTVFKNNTKSALPEGTNLVYTGQSTGNASVAYGTYNGSHLDQIFNNSGGTIQFTGMLVDLEDDYLDDELIMRPYMVLQSPSGEQITIHGGSLQRNIGYVAWQNRNYNGSSEAKAFIQNIIDKVYG